MSRWTPPTMSLYVCVTLLTNHQQICVLTCAQPTWSLTEFLPYSTNHSPTLWRHRWQEASEFMCTKTPLFGQSWATKNIAKKTRKCSLWRVRERGVRVFLKKILKKFGAWRRQKKISKFDFANNNWVQRQVQESDLIFCHGGHKTQGTDFKKLWTCLG